MSQNRGGGLSCLIGLLGGFVGGWAVFQAKDSLLQHLFHLLGTPSDPTIRETLLGGIILAGAFLGLVLGGIVATLLVSIVSAILTAIIPSRRRAAKICSRQKMALRKNIKQQAESVVSNLGNKYGYYSDDRIYVQVVGRSAIIRSGDGAKGDLVFEGVYVPAEYSSQDLGTFLEPQDDGSYKVDHRTSTSRRDAFVDIKAYVPGKWESHLEMLSRKAARQVEENRRREIEEAKAEKTRRFGL